MRPGGPGATCPASMSARSPRTVLRWPGWPGSTSRCRKWRETLPRRWVCWLARDGPSNAEIGAHLFQSVRTVERHLRKIYTKLGIGTRRELRDPLG